MNDTRDTNKEDEPVGIIISRGSRSESAPRFAAYIWSQVSEPIPAPSGSKAAA